MVRGRLFQVRRRASRGPKSEREKKYKNYRVWARVCARTQMLKREKHVSRRYLSSGSALMNAAITRVGGDATWPRDYRRYRGRGQTPLFVKTIRLRGLWTLSGAGIAGLGKKPSTPLNHSRRLEPSASSEHVRPAHETPRASGERLASERSNCKRATISAACILPDNDGPGTRVKRAYAARRRHRVCPTSLFRILGSRDGEHFLGAQFFKSSNFFSAYFENFDV